MLATSRATFTAHRLRLSARDGCTLNPATGDDAPHTYGYWVGGVAPSVTLSDDIMRDESRAIGVILPQVEAAMSHRHYVGVWRDSDTGTTWVDVSQWVPDEPSALRIARDRGEIAVWSIAGGCEVRV